MSDVSQPQLTLNDVAEFHQQLMRLQAADLRLQLDDGSVAQRNTTNRSLAERLNEIMAGLASQAGDSKSLDQVLREASFIPLRYRLALETWHTCDRSVESLSALRSPVQDDSEGAADLRYALLLPSIILILIYCASFYLLLVTVPSMEAIYLQLSATPSLPVRWLIAIRTAMPYWGPGIPILIGLVWFLLISGHLTLPRWLPGRWQASRYLAASSLARNLATQIDQTNNSQSLGSLAVSPDSSSSMPGVIQSPMLRWALSATSGREPAESAEVTAQQQSRRLHLAANLYERMQTIRSQQFRIGLTLFACIFLGGGLTLLYSLTLFAPLVQLLKDIVGY